MNWIATIPAANLTASALLGLAVLLVFSGLLIPRWVVTQIKANADANTAQAQREADNWKAAYQAVATARELQSKQLDDLLELARTQDQFIRALPAASRKAAS